MIGFDTPLADLPSTSAVAGTLRRHGKALRTGGFTTVGDILWHIPRRYERRGDLTSLADLVVGDYATVVARVAATRVVPLRQRRGSMFEVTITDGHGEAKLVFFGGSEQAWRQRELRRDIVALFSGKVGAYRGVVQFSHPEVRPLPADWGGGLFGDDVDPAQPALAVDPAQRALAADPDSPTAAALAAGFAGEVLPVYPATGKLPSWVFGDLAKGLLQEDIDAADPIPPDVQQRLGLVDRLTAFRALHVPAALDEPEIGRRRLAHEEAFVLQAELLRRRHAARALPAVARLAQGGGLLGALDARLPYRLTDAQVRVGAEIRADLARDFPMHRLLQGDVGSGKTVVALRAMLAVVDAGGQAALLAPTEVLAAQHHRSITGLLGPLAEAGTLLTRPRHAESAPATRVTLLTGSLGQAATRSALAEIASGNAGIVIGTHALLAERVQFADLGLVVVDEQHRFGVEQRAALAVATGSAKRPHVLVMTATPIPRTVAMTAFGDLDVSVLDAAPTRRAGVVTHVVPTERRPDLLERAWDRVREEVSAGHRVYVVCPRIDADHDEETDDAAEAGEAQRRLVSVEELAAWLRDGPLRGIGVGVLHSRVALADRDRAMAAFIDGTTPVLVATTVIEVGVDVHQASTMVIMDADRFGTATLHQLRGRVGRGTIPGLCLLVTPVAGDTPAADRVRAVAATTDGFALAELDLASRRAGDVLGAAQHGKHSGLRVLSVTRAADVELLASARREAQLVLDRDPDLSAEPALVAAIAALVGPERAAFLEKG